MGATLFLLLFVVGILLTIGGSVLGTVQAFQVSLVWGLLCLFVPFALFVFIAKFWNREWVRRSLFMVLGGTVMAIAGIVSGGFLLTEPDIPAFQEGEDEPIAGEPIPLPPAGLPQADPAEGETLPDGTIAPPAAGVVAAAPQAVPNCSPGNGHATLQTHACRGGACATSSTEFSKRWSRRCFWVPPRSS